MTTTPRPFLIGVGGGSGSGKSTVAHTLCRWYEPDSVLLPQDCYYRDRPGLAPEQRQSVNYDEPDAIDHALLLEHIRRLARGETIQRPRYDFAHHRRAAGADAVAADGLIVIEGLFAWWDDAIRSALDLRIFVDAQPDVRLIRRLTRDMRERGRTAESIIGQYLRTVRPMHAAWIEPARQQAHLVIENSGSMEDLLLSLHRIIAPHLPPR